MTATGRGRPAYVQVSGEPSERMGWITGRGDLPSLLRQYAGYIERGGDNRPTGVASHTEAVPPAPEPPEEAEP